MSTEANEATFFGHPKGLSVLFFTEMWERFSYYGMRALLILFMTAATTGLNPGMGLDFATAGAIYGLYTGMVYLLTLPGGWIADNLWGQRKAVWVGGWFIAAGHFSMAMGIEASFYTGLVLITIGTGLLKPNVSTVVGDLYPEGGARRDAGFSLFYMGINLGALFGPMVTSFLGEGYHWHWGFGVAGVGMVFGLIQFRMGERHLGDCGKLSTDLNPEELSALSRKAAMIMTAFAALLGLFVASVYTGVIDVSLVQIAQTLGASILVIVGLFFVYLIGWGGHTKEENKKLFVILWLFILIAIFWSGFEQAGSSLSLFARDFTDRYIFGWLMPAGYLQMVNAGFIIILAPVFGSMWVWLAHRNANPSIPVKFGLGLLGLSAGFFVIAWGAANATAEAGAPMAWLVVMYFLHTVGELAISPCGLSSITKLAPKRRVGQMMGIWFVGAALGNVFAGLVAGELTNLAPSGLFRTVGMIVGAAGIFALLVSPGVKKMMGDVE